MDVYDRGFYADVAPHRVAIHGPERPVLKDGDAVSTFAVRHGEKAVFSLSYSPSRLPPRKPDIPAKAQPTTVVP